MTGLLCDPRRGSSPVGASVSLSAREDAEPAGTSFLQLWGLWLWLPEMIGEVDFLLKKKKRSKEGSKLTLWVEKSVMGSVAFPVMEPNPI